MRTRPQSVRSHLHSRCIITPYNINSSTNDVVTSFHYTDIISYCQCNHHALGNIAVRYNYTAVAVMLT